MAKTPDRSELDGSLESIIELQEFLFPLLTYAASKPRKPGDDIGALAKEAGLKVPAALKGEKIEWAPRDDASATDKIGPSISIVRPGNPGALGLTIGCIRVRKWRICLECGWLWCRIVVTRRF